MRRRVADCGFRWQGGRLTQPSRFGLIRKGAGRAAQPNWRKPLLPEWQMSGGPTPVAERYLGQPRRRVRPPHDRPDRLHRRSHRRRTRRRTRRLPRRRHRHRREHLRREHHRLLRQVLSQRRCRRCCRLEPPHRSHQYCWTFWGRTSHWGLPDLGLRPIRRLAQRRRHCRTSATAPPMPSGCLKLLGPGRHAGHWILESMGLTAGRALRPALRAPARRRALPAVRLRMWQAVQPK